MWITAAFSAASIGAVVWIVVAKRTAAKNGETLRETLWRQWRNAGEDAPDVTPQDLKEANQLTVADELDGGGYVDTGGSHGEAGWDSGHHH